MFIYTFVVVQQWSYFWESLQTIQGWQHNLNGGNSQMRKSKEKREGEKKRKTKQKTNLWEQPGECRGTMRMPTILKPPFLKKGLFLA